MVGFIVAVVLEFVALGFVEDVIVLMVCSVVFFVLGT